MGNITTVGLDLAKNVFQVHGVDAEGTAVVRQRLTRGRMLKFFAKLPPCLIGIEACASSHYWARELVALGHDVKLMPAQYVKPYVKRGKNDAADAEAICEAVTRPTMRFVGIKTPEQQSAMMLHRVRLILNRQRTQLSNAMRAHLAEFGVVGPIGRNGIEQLLDVIADPTDERVPADARVCLEMLATQLRMVKEQILENDRRILASARETELGRRLMEIPGVGPLLASAMVATVPDPAVSARVANLPRGSVWCRDRTPVAARSGLAASPRPGSSTCARCSLSARWRSCGTRSATGPSGRGSCNCSRGASPRSQRSR